MTIDVEKIRALKATLVDFKRRLSDVGTLAPSNLEILEFVREVEGVRTAAGDLQQEGWRLFCEQGDPTPNDLRWAEVNLPPFSTEARLLLRQLMDAEEAEEEMRLTGS